MTNETNLSATSRNNNKLSIGPAKDPTATNLEHTSSNNKQSINPEPFVGTNENPFTPVVAVGPTTTIDNHTICQPNRKKLPSPLLNANVTKIPATGNNSKTLSTNTTDAPTASNLEHASPNKEQSITPKAILGTNVEHFTHIATAAPTTIDNHINRSPNNETDNRKQRISMATMVNATLRALLVKGLRKEICAGVVASIRRTSTTNEELPKSPTGPTATDVITNTSKNVQDSMISPNAPLATTIGPNISQNIRASTTTTAAAPPMPTVHDSPVLQNPPPPQTTNKSKSTTNAVNTPLPTIDNLDAPSKLPTYFGLQNLYQDIQISHFSTNARSTPQQIQTKESTQKRAPTSSTWSRQQQQLVPTVRKSLRMLDLKPRPPPQGKSIESKDQTSNSNTAGKKVSAYKEAPKRFKLATNPSIRKQNMDLLLDDIIKRQIGNVVIDKGGYKRISAEARQAFLIGSEDYLIQKFQTVNECAAHDNRVTIQPKDLALVEKLSGVGVRRNYYFS